MVIVVSLGIVVAKPNIHLLMAATLLDSARPEESQPSSRRQFVIQTVETHISAVPSVEVMGLRKHPVCDTENLPGLDIDQQGVEAIAHPYVAIGWVHQSVIPVAAQPISTAPECGRQGLAIDPPPAVPAFWLHIGLRVIAAFGVPIGLEGARVEVLAILLCLRRAMTWLIRGPIVAMALLALLLLGLLLQRLLRLLQRLLLLLGLLLERLPWLL